MVVVGSEVVVIFFGLGVVVGPDAVVIVVGLVVSNRKKE